MRVGSSTGSYYYYGKAATPNSGMIMKTDSSGSVLWTRIYEQTGAFYMFEVDPSETYIYFAQYSSTIFSMARIATSDGLVSASKKITAFYSNFYTAMRFYSTTNTLFFSGYGGGPRAVLCSTDASGWATAE